MKHYLHPTLLAADGHQVTCDLVGCGGTGSMLLTHLARLHLSLQARGHLGLHVRVFDPDVVEQANLVRQHFTHHDLGRNKATAAVERLNRFYGLSWQAIPLRWDENWVKVHAGQPFPFANITISCVDTVQARRTIWDTARLPWPQWQRCFGEDGGVNTLKTRTPAHQQLYWLDVGNAKDVGQVVLATFGELPQPNYAGRMNTLTRLHPGHQLRLLADNGLQDRFNGSLPSLFDMYGDLQEFEDSAEQGPSCSLQQALSRQSLMVNPMVATAAANLLAQMFEQTELQYHGCYLNLRTLTSSPIPVPTVPDDPRPTTPNRAQPAAARLNGNSHRHRSPGLPARVHPR